jgi:hypothetical protein
MPVDITNVSITFHDERKREEYGPVKKAEATITATVANGQDGALVLDIISAMATAKVRTLLSIEGAVAPQAQAATPAHGPEAGKALSEIVDRPPVEAPKQNIRRNADEIARGLTVEQAVAERAAKAAGSTSTTSGSATDAPPASQDNAGSTPQTSEQPSTDGSPAADDWDAPVTAVVITDDELNKTCASTADRIGDPLKVRATKELFNPTPGQPFRAVEIPQEKRADFIAKLNAL